MREQLLEAQTEIVRAAELGDGEAMRAAALLNSSAQCDAQRDDLEQERQRSDQQVA